MKIDCFETLFPGLAVFDDETKELVVSLDDHCFIVRGSRPAGVTQEFSWWWILPAIMVEQNTNDVNWGKPAVERLLDMIMGAALITDLDSARIAVRDYVCEEIWAKARRDKSLIKNDSQPSL